MIPNFITLTGCLWPLLPAGVHDATLEEVQQRFVINEKREKLFIGLKRGLNHLFACGCPQVFLDGSYVTEKPNPSDYEVCWDVQFVNPANLDPVFMDFDNARFNQKQKYLGEYFPSILIEGNSGKPFLDFFQTDKETGKPKGIIRITNYLNKGGVI